MTEIDGEIGELAEDAVVTLVLLEEANSALLVAHVVDDAGDEHRAAPALPLLASVAPASIRHATDAFMSITAWPWILPSASAEYGSLSQPWQTGFVSMWPVRTSVGPGRPESATPITFARPASASCW